MLFCCHPCLRMEGTQIALYAPVLPACALRVPQYVFVEKLLTFTPFQYVIIDWYTSDNITGL